MAILNKVITFPDGALTNPKKNDKINYILNFMFDMCDAPYSVYVRTLWPALLEAIITYYDLDPIQIFTKWAKPPTVYKDARGGKHGKGNRRTRGSRTYRRYWRSFSGFDPNNSIGGMFPPRDGFFPYSGTPGVHTLWHLYDVEQRVMYWIMIYEVTEQFFYKWSSGVARSYYCQAQYRPICLCQSVDDGNIPLVELSPIFIEEVIKARHTLWAAGNGIAVWGQGSQAFFSAKITSFGEAPPGTPGCKLVITHADGTREESADFTNVGERVTVSAGTVAEGMWQFWTTGPAYFLLQELEMTVIGSQNYIENV